MVISIFSQAIIGLKHPTGKPTRSELRKNLMAPRDIAIAFLDFTMDVNQDGWDDYICFDFPGAGVYWYENPQGEEKHWTEYLIDSMACNESPMMVDLDGDGRQELVFGNQKRSEMMWFQPPKKPGDTQVDRTGYRHTPGRRNPSIFTRIGMGGYQWRSNQRHHCTGRLVGSTLRSAEISLEIS